LAFKHAYVLTGGIACGKSTVSKLLSLADFAILDADVIAREQLNLHVDEAKELFGEQICDNNIINRKKLAEIVFNSKEQRAKLNNLLHPLIRKDIAQKAKELDKIGLPYIIDIPLYFESGEYDCKMSVVVYIPKDMQLKRLISRDKITEYEAIQRVESQIGIDKKRDMADWIIDNSKDIKHLEEETEKFIKYVRGEYANIKI